MQPPVAEQVLFQHEDLLITTSRLAVGPDTYPVRQVSGVSAEGKQLRFTDLGRILLCVGLPVALAGFYPLSMPASGHKGVGVIMLLGGLACAAMAWVLGEVRYEELIHFTCGGRRRRLWLPDQAAAAQAYQALTKAIT